MKKRLPILIVLSLLIGLMLVSGCGRKKSRLMGRDHRQVLQVENMAEFIGLSMSKKGSNTIKDVTFKAGDGYVYTQEFKDVNPLEGVIPWVPHGQDDSFIKTRAISRWTGKAVNLELPADCQEILGVDVDSENKVKNLIFRSTDGNIYSKEYRDGIVGRKFEGWLEVRKKE